MNEECLNAWRGGLISLPLPSIQGIGIRTDFFSSFVGDYFDSSNKRKNSILLKGAFNFQLKKAKKKKKKKCF